MSAKRHSLRASRVWGAALLLAIALFACYSNHFGNSFHFDDSHTVVQNPYIRSLSNIPRFFTDATTFSVLPANRTWRPLVSVSLAFDYWLGGGLKPFWFHVSTFIWYLAQLAVMFLLFRRILHFADGSAWVDLCALFAVAWYGLHPAMAETVNYIIQRGDVYSTFGVIASLAIFVLTPGTRRFGLYMIPAALGMLAKPPAAIFPAILFAWVFLFETDAEPRRWLFALRKSGIAWLITAVLMLLNTRMTPRSWTPGSVSPHDYLITQPFVALHYFVSLFAPLSLTADTDLNAFATIFTPQAFAGLIFAVMLACAIWFTFRRRVLRPICFGLAWFVLTLLPTALFPLAEVENDHRMFMPFAGLVLAVAWAAALAIRPHLTMKPLYAAILAALILACYGHGAWSRNRAWATEETLWKDVTIKSPHNGRGLMNYGLTLMAKGQTAEALDYFEKASQFTPNYYVLEINTAIADGVLGHDAEAERHFNRALLLAPADNLPDYYFGRWLHQKGRSLDAIAHLQSSVGKNPAYPDSRYELMQAYAEQGMNSEVASLAHETISLMPGDPVATRFLNSGSQANIIRVSDARQQGQSPEELISLSLIYNKAGRYRDSIEAAQLALKLHPGLAEAWNNIAAGHEALGEWDEAIHAASEAVALKPDFQLAKNNLAWSRQQKSIVRSMAY
jgi:tetratricopeptide (TPR) repeat protein